MAQVGPFVIKAFINIQLTTEILSADISNGLMNADMIGTCCCKRVCRNRLTLASDLSYCNNISMAYSALEKYLALEVQ